ncbi:MAG TPA: phosphate ABC transporter substrate-binding protein PstS [Sporichthyaceae bacterium]
MKLRPHGRVAVTLGACLALAACGSDNNTATTNQQPVNVAPVSTVQTPSAVATTASTSSNGISCSGSGVLNGEGSTAQANAISSWVSTYQAACSGVTINYNGTGSGAGVKQFTANQVDWAGSDSALKPEEIDPAKARCGGNDVYDIPMAVGPIAVAYNLAGIDGLVLDGPAIAKIFTGKITKWDDQAIKDLNPSVSLPSKDIKVFFRSDESGTTENFEKYMAAAGGGNWTAAPGKAFGGGVGEGQTKSAGVQQAVKATDGGIAYIEYSYAKDANLGVAKVKTGTDAVELTAENAGKALAAATLVGTGNDLSLKLDYTTTQPGAYPIVLVTYEIVCSKGLDATKTGILKSFLSYLASDAGQQAISSIGYGTLPADLVAKITASIAAISA